MLVPWTALQPSSRARQWRRAGVAIALASCATLFAAAFLSDPFDPIAALLGGVGCLSAWLAMRPRKPRRIEVGVSSLGQVMLREGDDWEIGKSATVEMPFASAWLISLRRGTMLVAIWPDSLPPSAYRQLWVHLRWGRAMPSDDRGASPSIRADSADR